MEELPEVLRFVISKALASGKKLSWSVWNNGEMTSYSEVVLEARSRTLAVIVGSFATSVNFFLLLSF